MIVELTETPSLSMEVRLARRPSVEARMPEATKRAMPVRLIWDGGIATTSPERMMTWTRATTMDPVMGFESLMPLRFRTALTP